MDGEAEATVLVLMKREGGVLLVAPSSFLPQQLLDEGNAEDADGILPASSKSPQC